MPDASHSNEIENRNVINLLRFSTLNVLGLFSIFEVNFVTNQATFGRFQVMAFYLKKTFLYK